MNKLVEKNLRDLERSRKAPLATRTDLSAAATRDIAAAMNAMDEQADQIFAITDTVAERVRKLGGTTLRSVGEIARRQRILDNDAQYVSPLDMLAEVRDDNKQLSLRGIQARRCAKTLIAHAGLICVGNQPMVDGRQSLERYPMEERGRDASVLAHIQRLVTEEHGLFEEGELPPDKSKRLAEVQIELDQCWDLLRQRRALRETGQDPSQAHARPPDIVEKYIG